MQANNLMWFRISIALVVVLLVLVAGVVGVGVSGKLPGIGEIQIVQPGSTEEDSPKKTEAPPEPEPEAPKADSPKKTEAPPEPEPEPEAPKAE